MEDDIDRALAAKDARIAELETTLGAVRKDATRASAELRHAFKVKQDWNLVSRAIVILETAATPGAHPDGFEREIRDLRAALDAEKAARVKAEKLLRAMEIAAADLPGMDNPRSWHDVAHAADVLKAEPERIRAHVEAEREACEMAVRSIAPVPETGVAALYLAAKAIYSRGGGA